MKQTTSRVATRQFHKWLIPEKTVMGIFSLGVIFVFAGAVLVAIAGLSSGALAIVGGILLAVGFILLVICTCLCAHAWCVWHVRDVETQTVQTSVTGTDHIDGEWSNGFGPSEVKVPNGVLRDGRLASTASKKHVTISPKSHDMYDSGRLNGGHTPGRKSGPGSVTSETPSTLASLSYLSDPTFATPYSSLSQKRPYQSQSGFSQSSGYGSVPRQGGEYGRTVQVRPYYSEGSMGRQNVLPGRRHSDDDYDNASDMQPMLVNQTFPQQPTPQPWQHPPPMSSWQHHQGQQQPYQQRGGLQQQQQQHYQQQQQNQHSQQHQNQSQYQTQRIQQQQQPVGGQQHWRQMNISFEDPPPAQPLVYPSARRPMTFEQISSSKVSLYDNMQMNRKDDDE